MRFVSPMHRRHPSMRSFDDLSAAVRRHLSEELAFLREREARVARQLGLTDKPRLTIVDEETTTLVTASERSAFEMAAKRDEQE